MNRALGSLSAVLLTGWFLQSRTADAAGLNALCEPGTELSRLRGQSGRTDAFIFHNDHLIQKQHGTDQALVWRMNDPSAPVLLREFDKGWGGNHVVTFIGEVVLLNWAGHHQTDLAALPELTDLEYELFNPRDGVLAAMGGNSDGIAQSYYPLGFGNTPWAYGYARKEFMTVHDLRQPQQEGPEGWSRTPLSRIDVLEETGFEGRPNLIGNLLIVTGDNETPEGVAVYDLSDPTQPVLLDSLRTTPDGEPLIKAYDSVPVWGSYIILANNGDTTRDRGVDVIDFSDPSNLRHVGRYDFPGRTRYAQFQDEYMFVGDAKVNMETFAVEQTFPDGGGEYNLPVGNLLITAGMERPDNGRIWCHQDTPDTRPPMVTFHSPADRETDVAVTGRVGLVIPETLDLATLSTDNIILRPIGGSPVPADIVSTDHDVLNLTPREPLRPHTTYEFVMAAGGVSDVAGNALEENFRFVFSTGSRINTSLGARFLDRLRRLAGSLSGDRGQKYTLPELVEIEIDRTTAPVGQPITYTVQATAPGGAALEYSFIWGDGTQTGYQESNTASHHYARPGIFSAQVRARVVGGHFAARAVNVNVYSDGLRPGVSSSSIVLSADRERVWNVNPDNDTISAVAVGSGELLLEVPVPADPRSLAVDSEGRLWVVSHDAAAITVLSDKSGEVVAAFSLPAGSRPVGIVLSPDSTVGYVSAMGDGRIYRLDVANASVTDSLAVGPWPRALALSADGSTLLATRLISPDHQGEVYRIDTDDFTLRGVIPLAMDETSIDSDRSARGVPNYLTSIAIAPDGHTVWVGSKEDNVLRGMLRDGSALTFETTVRSVISRIDLDNDAEIPGSRIDVDNQELPTAITFSSDGLLAYISYQGNNNVVVLNTQSLGVVDRIEVGRAPKGLAVDPTTGDLFVHSFLSRSVRQLSIYTGLAGNMWSAVSGSISGLEERFWAETVTEEKLGHRALTGKRLFYDASDARISTDGYLSCASCHLDGEHDGRVWDFTDRGEGLRNTISLVGRRGTGHGAMHWSANFDEVQDFENDIRGSFRGEGLMADYEFFLDPHPLGLPRTGRSPDLDHLNAYLESLDSFGDSPHRSADGSLTSSGARGRGVFARLGCGSCHGGESFTDSATGVRHDVGTVKASSGGRLGGSLVGIDTPTLRGLWSTAPYLHDGSAPTLHHLLDSAAHGATGSLTADERDDLVAFLLQIDDSEPAAAEPDTALALDCTVDTAGTTITLSAAASLSDLSEVVYYADDAEIGRSSSVPFTIDWALPEARRYRVFAATRHSDGRVRSLTPELSLDPELSACSQEDFVDDFEDDAPGAGLGLPWRISGSVGVSTEYAYSGTQSVRVSARGGGYNRSYLTLDMQRFDEINQKLYGRMMIRVDASGGGDFSFVQAEGEVRQRSSAPTGTRAMYRYRASEGNLMANYDTWADANSDGQTDWQTDCWRPSSTPLPVEEWACLEWHFDAERDTLEYWLNGEAVSDIRVEGGHDSCANTQTQDGQWIGPERFSELHLGIEQYHDTASPRVIFIDDVQLSDAPIGCP